MIKKAYGILFVLIAAWGIWYFSPHSTITVDQVDLQGVLYSSEQVSTPKFDSEWILDVEIKNSSNLPLSDVNDGDYVHIVTPYVEGFRSIGWEVFDDQSNSEQNFKMNNHSDVEKRVSAELQKLGLHGKVEDVNRIHGFTYIGDRESAKIRFYLIPMSKEVQAPPSRNGAFLFYTHLEEVWGKEVGWMKSAPIQY